MAYLPAESDTGMFGGNSKVAEEIARRLASIFLRDKDGRRPVYGRTRTFQEDPHWRDYRAMHLFATSTAEQFVEVGKGAGIIEVAGQARSGQTGSAARSRGR